MCNRHSCMYNSQDTIIPYIEYFVIRTCHIDKLYHKGHKGYVHMLQNSVTYIIGHYMVLIVRHLCINVKRFIYVYVIGVDTSVIWVIRCWCINTSKGLYVYVTGLGISVVWVIII